MTREQLIALMDFIRNEARYAADEVTRRNDSDDRLRQMRIEENLREAFGHGDA